MTSIFGKYTPCDKEDVSCGCEYVYCEHSKSILKRYGSSVYGSGHKLRQIIQVLLDYQEESIKGLCETPLPLKPIVQLLGFNCCYYESTPGDCIELCGGNYTPHNFDNCQNECIEQTLDDDIFLKILSIKEYINYPSRENIQAICDIFGWGLIYTDDYINILLGGDSPSVYKFIIDKIPTPIGVNIRELTSC